MWRHSVHLEISGKQKKPATDLACFTTSAECSFFLRGDYPVHYLYCYHCRSLEHVWLEIISLKSSHDRAREVVERLASHWQNPLDRMTSQKGGPAAEYCAKWQQRRRILSICEDEFHKENLLHFRVWKFGEELNLVRDFYLCWQKYTLWVTFSFEPNLGRESHNQMAVADLGSRLLGRLSNGTTKRGNSRSDIPLSVTFYGRH